MLPAGFTLGDAVTVARSWAGMIAPMGCLGGDLNMMNGFTLGDAIFTAQVWAGMRQFLWAAARPPGALAVPGA